MKITLGGKTMIWPKNITGHVSLAEVYKPGKGYMFPKIKPVLNQDNQNLNQN